MGISVKEDPFITSIKREIGSFKEHAERGWDLMPVPDFSRRESVKLAVNKILPEHKVYFLNFSELMKIFGQLKACTSDDILVSSMFGMFMKGSIGNSFGNAVNGKFRNNLIEHVGLPKFNLLLKSFVSRPPDNKSHFGNVVWDATTVHVSKFPKFINSYWKGELQKLAWESITYLLLYKTGFSISEDKTENSDKFKAVCAYLPHWMPICIRKNSKEVVFLAR